MAGLGACACLRRFTQTPKLWNIITCSLEFFEMLVSKAGAFAQLFNCLATQTVKVTTCNAGDLGSIPGSEDPPEKGTATHSSILAWRIPWTEEPGGLQSMGSQRVRHD